MKIGIGLPNPVPNIPLLVDWAQRAEAAGFSGLVTIDRIAYPGYDSLTTLAAAAGATQQISLMTNILLAPIYTPVLLAKSAASIDQISSGRFSLGLAAGGRQDDYEVTSRDFHRRGREFDNALDVMRRVWRGETLVPNSAPASRRRLGTSASPSSSAARVRRPSNVLSRGGPAGPREARKLLTLERLLTEYAAPGRKPDVAVSLGSPHSPTTRWATRRRRRRVGTCWTTTASSATLRAGLQSLPIDRFPRCARRRRDLRMPVSRSSISIRQRPHSTKLTA